MRKEEISVIAQLLSSMRDAVERLEGAYNKKDAETLASAKREILELQIEIKKRL